MVSDPIAQWRAAFPINEAAERLDALKRDAEAIEREMAQLMRDLEMYATRPTAMTAEESAAAAEPVNRPSGMDAVEAVMREQPGVWTRLAINQELVRKRWLAPGETGRRTLGSIMHRMVARGRVVRVGEGRYALPASDQGVLAA